MFFVLSTANDGKIDAIIPKAQYIIYKFCNTRDDNFDGFLPILRLYLMTLDG
uniref:Uncharacterized protein n=1 Tax=Lepeophtheirus salmonis TaxID=72036 RepID=A0A0K2TFM6_LEPSM